MNDPWQRSFCFHSGIVNITMRVKKLRITRIDIYLPVNKKRDGSVYDGAAMYDTA